MASRSSVPPQSRSPQSRHVDVDPTSIDADDYRAGLDAGGVDLGRVDLFGANDGGDGENGMAMPSSNTSATTMEAPVATTTQQGRVQRPTTAMTRKNRMIRARTSDVLNDFEELFEVVNGKKTRYAARCHYCKKVLTILSTGGTGHLLRHRKSCARKADRVANSQSVLKYNSDSYVRNWDYNPDVAHIELDRLIARLDLPLGIDAYDAFVEYIRRAHNPRYNHVCRQTTTTDFVKHFNQTHTLMMECLSTCTSIAITSDIWNDNAKEDYLSVVAHFINSDWELEKKLTDIRLIDVSHSGSNIAERVGIVLDD
jgi:hypothetical protein